MACEFVYLRETRPTSVTYPYAPSTTTHDLYTSALTERGAAYTRAPDRQPRTPATLRR